MKHVIIGAGAAGMTAAKTIRALQPEDEIVLISEDEQINSRCMLHHYLSGERNEATLSFVPNDFFEKNRIEWHKGVKVTGVDTHAKVVHCGQETLSYDKLLIAAGSVNSSIPVAELCGAKNVYGFQSLADAQVIREKAAKAQRIAVIGAGFIGLDAAYALLELKKDVTVVVRGKRILSRNLDERSASAYQERFEAQGCKFLFGCKTVSANVDDSGNVTELIFDNGTTLPCDFVITAAGVRPAVAFLEGSGINAAKAVEVDQYMATNCPDVYAAGDITGLSGIWPNAMRQGEVAAKNMCGYTEAYDDSFTAKNTVHFYGLSTLTLGEFEPNIGDQLELCDDMRSYRKLILRDGCVKGAVIQGDISNSGFWQYIIKHGIQIDKIKKPVWKISFADFFALDETGKYLYAVNA
ncbi:MAG: FAD-dependent oxidoreductase [Dehalococcoidia bacterium]|nr:FAD-dependent oxidoreductase [Dehalococcoidia bacterium]